MPASLDSANIISAASPTSGNPAITQAANAAADERSEIGLPCTICSDKDTYIKSLEAEIEQYEGTINMDCEIEKMRNSKVEAYDKLEVKLSQARKKLAQANHEIDYYTKHRLQHTEYDLGKSKTALTQQIKTNKNLEQTAEAHAELQKRVKQAVRSGEISFVEAFGQLCLLHDEVLEDAGGSGDESVEGMDI